MFKVVPDQLRISDGWVRCGQCAEVFEAPEHLQPDPVPAPAADSGAADTNVRGEPPAADSPEISQEGPGEGPEKPEPAAQDAGAQQAPCATTLDAPPEAGSPAQADDREDGESWWIPLGTEVSPQEMHSDVAPPSSDAADPAQEVAPSASQETGVDLPLDEPAPVSDFLTGPSAGPALGPGPAGEPSAPQVSFVRAAQRKALWQSPQVRRLLTAVCAVLLMALGLQVVLQQRDRIAALQPRSLGLLQALCVPLRCAVEPLRQIESIVVDSSSFRKLGDNVYQLNLGIKNGASIALAMPSVELALTDTQDQPVLRRVLSPAELGAAAVLAAGAGWSGSLPVSVADSTMAARIAGYRVLAFYP